MHTDIWVRIPALYETQLIFIENSVFYFINDILKKNVNKKEKGKKKLPGGESNPALARTSRIMTGACTNPIYYQGINKSTKWP